MNEISPSFNLLHLLQPRCSMEKRGAPTIVFHVRARPLAQQVEGQLRVAIHSLGRLSLKIIRESGIHPVASKGGPHVLELLFRLTFCKTDYSTV